MKHFFFSCICLLALQANAQADIPITDTAATKKLLININQGLDQAVVDKQALFLKNHYAPDFYFLHGTGQVDSKQSWMRSVLDTATHYQYRRHDSVAVELHGDVAIVTGILTVKRATGTNSRYALRYMRLYAHRKGIWQLLSHRTAQERHLPD
jgi:ketosteroid isomerase-like protein